MARPICICNNVRENEILDTLSKTDFPSLELIQKETGAATNCGRCINAIEAIIQKASVGKR
ncbi:(2Fe-2S)-binding protein [Carboxylicivirga sp. A043]|uniref:(2Fe-2S)-binding protein n=1 Tax=Carboxylicivirga litoralis TaxID=2816963 RepID=UPI0021CB6873|nr:(2Fe-2S)-binding protein [Carboxylicivirga sp. A043]MCU4156862.1 (2Fe-2S)-binding protein [Carboxylicivirga sp. A043]